MTLNLDEWKRANRRIDDVIKGIEPTLLDQQKYICPRTRNRCPYLGGQVPCPDWEENKDKTGLCSLAKEWVRNTLRR